jgi:hypothetical protein
MPPRKKRDRRRWYSVSVDTLRLLGFPIVALLVVLVGWVSYGAWEEARIQGQTADLIGEVQILFEQLKTLKVKEGYRKEYDGAWNKYQQASSAVNAEDYRTALPLLVASRDTLLAIRSALGGAPDAQFLSVEGGVEFRRGERGRWQPARQNVQLQPGDYVRTSGGGSAEILFPDGTLFVVRKDSQVVISHTQSGGGEAAEQTMEMEYGWVDLNTRNTPGKVRTPKAEARVDSDSEVFVAYERSRQEGRFGAIRGGLELRPKGGEPRRIGELEQVVQRGETVSETFPLPQSPELLYPPDNFEIDPDQVKEVTLSWESVEGAKSYALQVSDNHLFGNNIVEDMERTRTSARLGIRGEGSFMWQVAARAPDGSLGPWSPTRSFRVASLSRRSAVEDHTPPEVEILSYQAYGNMYIVRGRTEPGAMVSVNGQGVTVKADGSFTKTVEFREEGAATIVVVARDAWGNESEDKEPVFVEVP